jgi:hypothetical protein
MTKDNSEERETGCRRLFLDFLIAGLWRSSMTFAHRGCEARLAVDCLPRTDQWWLEAPRGVYDFRFSASCETEEHSTKHSWIAISERASTRSARLARPTCDRGDTRDYRRSQLE